jgi:hypothetical protein
MIGDMWKAAIPQPNLINGKQVRMINEKQFRKFAALVLRKMVK